MTDLALFLDGGAPDGGPVSATAVAGAVTERLDYDLASADGTDFTYGGPGVDGPIVVDAGQDGGAPPDAGLADGGADGWSAARRRHGARTGPGCSCHTVIGEGTGWLMLGVMVTGLRRRRAGRTTGRCC